MTVKALNRGVRQSPRKTSIVAALVRGRNVADAITILEHTPRRSAEAIKKAILSAKANAEHNHSFKPESLFISEISVTSGTRFRRYRPAARGRALKFQRKTSHIKVVLDGEKRVSKKTPSKAADKESK